ncbi:MAG: hypothetical protein KatS3mg032_0526 [Cyclobacteriaceae bacterium]|nr:MAG: hypothetical protein KatS3mg032_0526 [Cyclobacteriaceae bacterium]
MRRFLSCLILILTTTVFYAFSQPQNAEGPEHWQQVDIVTTPPAGESYHKIGMVTAKATGTTEFSSVSRVTIRAHQKLQMACAMAGGQVVQLAFTAIEGNLPLLRTSRAQLIGFAYTKNPVQLDSAQAYIQQGNWKVVGLFKFLNNSSRIKFRLLNNFGGIALRSAEPRPDGIWITGTAKGKVRQYRISYLSPGRMLLFYQKGARMYNLMVLKQ